GHLFYCPSHSGGTTYDAYKNQWAQGEGTIRCNYQYRGCGPSKTGYTLLLSRIDPSSVALVADGLRTQADFNHRIGGNVLRADLSVFWYRDSAGHILSALPSYEGDVDEEKTDEAWQLLDDELTK